MRANNLFKIIPNQFKRDYLEDFIKIYFEVFELSNLSEEFFDDIFGEIEYYIDKDLNTGEDLIK